MPINVSNAININVHKEAAQLSFIGFFMVLLIAMYRRVAIPAVTTKPINDGVYRDVKINPHLNV